MAHAFFDDSGKFSDSDFVCLAGYIADDNGWDQLSQKWGTLLLRHNIPYVHMKEMIALQGPYKQFGWTHQQRDTVLSEFIDVIREHVVAGFAVGVDAKYLRSMSKEARAAFSDPQMLCFQRLLRMIVRKLQSIGFPGTINPTFDDCEEYSVRCYKMWARLRKVAPELYRLVPCIAFADDAFFFPLQAADILAWETNKHLRQVASQNKTRKQLEQLMLSTTQGYGLEYISEVWDGEQLEETYKDIKSGKVKTL